MAIVFIKFKRNVSSLKIAIDTNNTCKKCCYREKNEHTNNLFMDDFQKHIL